MAALPRKGILQQPPNPYALSNIYPSIREVWVGNASADLLTGNVATRTAGTYLWGGEAGGSILIDYGLGLGINISSDGQFVPNYAETTVCILRRCRDTVNRQSSIFGFDGGGNNRFMCNAPWDDGNLYFDGWNANSNGRIVVTGFVKTTQWEVLTFVSSVIRGREVYRNGTLIGRNVSANASRTGGSAIPFNIGSPGSSGGQTAAESQEVALFVVAGTSWSPELIAKFGQDPLTSPWTLFTSPNRMIYSSVATSTFTSSGSRSGAGLNNMGSGLFKSILSAGLGSLG